LGYIYILTITIKATVVEPARCIGTKRAETYIVDGQRRFIDKLHQRLRLEAGYINKQLAICELYWGLKSREYQIIWKNCGAGNSLCVWTISIGVGSYSDTKFGS